MSASAALLTGKKGRRAIQALIAAPLMALAGVGGAGPVSAAALDATHLCVDSSSVGNVCLFDPGSGGVGHRAFWSALSPGGWFYPNWDGDIGEIVSNTNLCLQINASDGNFVRYAICSGDDAELWINYYNPQTGRTEFVSYWALHDGGEGYLCMSEDYNGGNRLVRADSCDPGGGTSYWYQQFGTS